jgi:DNA modification methylase
MAKSAKYYYNADAIAVPVNEIPHAPGWASSVSTRNDRGPDNESNQRNWGAKGKANKRSVWTITTSPFKEAHFATFPPALIEPMIKAGCPIGGIVLDPFLGSGTTGLVAFRLGCDFIGIDLNPKYCKMARKRIYGIFPEC